MRFLVIPCDVDILWFLALNTMSWSCLDIGPDLRSANDGFIKIGARRNWGRIMLTINFQMAKTPYSEKVKILPKCVLSFSA